MFTQLASSIVMAFQSLIGNKMRAMLTMLGIIIGVGSVITLTAIGQGASKAVTDRINSMGTNLIQVDPGPSNYGGISSGAGGSVHITEKDVEALKRSPLLSSVAPWVDTRGQVIGQGANWSTRIGGSTPAGLKIRNYVVEFGTVFTDDDAANGTKVCILGKTVVTNLFGDADPLGATIRIKQVPFTVIGVLKEKGSNSYGQDQDDIIIGPLATVQKKLMGTTWLNDIFASAVTEKNTTAAMADVTRIMREQHRLLPSDDNDFRVRSQVEMAATAQQSTDTLSLLLRSAAIIALLVGGIGIMNIMLVSVTERTREIGIRKSIGAKSLNILFQFMTEALTLSLIGGIIGIFAGFGASYIVSNQNGWSLIISPSAVALAFSAATAVGLFFGYYPAHKAAKLNPIEALRQE
ncbi:MAG: ABC transporter permease [Bacteroidota bacterium]|nr:ABC transporter permease [Bacteroidota bacterium]MDP4231374.1 ABC transporter permease [Bacteroidota bacterium]MDP4236582.1 ABC transporter permease [Bacteroidota bacterium]